LTLYLGIQYIKQRTSLVWVSLVLAITNTLHPSTIVLWPAVVFLACRRPEPSRNAGWTRWVSVILPPILVFSALSAFMLSGGHGPGAMLRDDRPGGADGIPFVPLVRVTTEWQHYTMFSPAHFLDWLNEHVLISPFGLFLILVAIFVVLSRRKPNTPEDANQAESPDLTSSSRANTGIILFLGIASLVYVLLTFVWNPDYGGQQDWDLFAPSAFVYTLLAAQLLVQVVYGSPKATNKSQALAWIGQLLIATSALHTIAWVYSNTIP
jgi:hypothetical protein